MDNLSQMYFFMFALSETICLFTGCLLAILPRITRKSLLFGVRIPDSAQNDPDVIRMKRIFTLIMTSATILILAAGALLYYLRSDSALLLSLYQPTSLLVVQYAAFIPLWKKSIRLKNARNWHVYHIGTSQTAVSGVKGRLKSMPWSWYVISFVLCVIAAAFAMIMYPSLPDTLATHFDANMTADAWAHKSPGVVLSMPLVAFGMILLLLGSNLILYFTKLQVSIENPVLSYAQHKMYRRLMSHMLGFITVIMTLMFLLLMPMVMNIYIPSAAAMYIGIFILTVLMVLPPILISVKAGQAGSKLKPVLTAQEEKEMQSFSSLSFGKSIDRGDDSFWKLGLFYYNKEDPSLFVEDRFGSNGGLNLARRTGQFIVAAIIMLVILTYAGSTILFVSMM